MANSLHEISKDVSLRQALLRGHFGSALEQVGGCYSGKWMLLGCIARIKTVSSTFCRQLIAVNSLATMSPKNLTRRDSVTMQKYERLVFNEIHSETGR